MPYRRRVDKSRAKSRLTLAAHTALTIGPPPTLGGEPDVPGVEAESDLERIYTDHRDKLLEESAPCTRPWGYWRFERDVPEELRAELPRLQPVAAGKPVSADRDVSLELARLVWLATENRLDADEGRKLPAIKRRFMGEAA